jgi:hypothetical protein
MPAEIDWDTTVGKADDVRRVFDTMTVLMAAMEGPAGPAYQVLQLVQLPVLPGDDGESRAGAR